MAADDEEEDEREEREKAMILKRETRGKSREKLLDHLKNKCQGVYKPQKLQKISKEISNYMERKAELEAELERLGVKQDKLTDRNVDNTNKNRKTGVSLEKKVNFEGTKEILATKSEEKRKSVLVDNLEEKEEIFVLRETLSDDQNISITESQKRIEIELKIKKLEDKKSRLKKEIEENEKIIRRKVLKHIFNNYDEIIKEKGGNVFVNNITEDNNN